jgi:hypothetical protein
MSRHLKTLERIIAKAESARIEQGLTDLDPLVKALRGVYVGRLLQAARDLDAESIRRAEEDPILRDVLG